MTEAIEVLQLRRDIRNKTIASKTAKETLNFSKNTATTGPRNIDFNTLYAKMKLSFGTMQTSNAVYPESIYAALNAENYLDSIKNDSTMSDARSTLVEMVNSGGMNIYELLDVIGGESLVARINSLTTIDMPSNPPSELLERELALAYKRNAEIQQEHMATRAELVRVTEEYENMQKQLLEFQQQQYQLLFPQRAKAASSTSSTNKTQNVSELADKLTRIINTFKKASDENNTTTTFNVSGTKVDATAVEDATAVATAAAGTTAGAVKEEIIEDIFIPVDIVDTVVDTAVATAAAGTTEGAVADSAVADDDKEEEI